MKFTTFAMSFVTSLILAVTGSAGAPLWSVVPTSPTTISVPADQTASVSYSVTNNSLRTQTLIMNAIPGVSQQTEGTDYCANPFTLGPHQSCSLVLLISGANIPESGIAGGPVICAINNINQCYQPQASNILNVTKLAPLNVGDSSLAGAANGSNIALVVLLGIGLMVLIWWGWRIWKQKRTSETNVKIGG